MQEYGRCMRYMGRYESKGGYPMRRCLALLAALCMLMSFALAEGVPLQELIVLADQTAAGALEIDHMYCGLRPLAVDANEDGDALRILADVYLADDQLEKLTDEQYEQVQWLDKRAVVEMKRVEGTWTVTSFSMEAELEMEDAAMAYFAETMVNYVNADLGYAIQYPALFGEGEIITGETGISGRMEGASFAVECLANDDAWTIDALLENKKQETNGAETNINTITGLGWLRYTQEGQEITYMAIVTEELIYQAELRYDQGLMRDFRQYGEYMMNSFTVDENGNG